MRGLVFPFYLAGKWGEGISFSLLPGRKMGGGGGGVGGGG